MTDIEHAVCQDIMQRQQLGIAKYGTTVAANPLDLRAWLQHAYEECLDQAVYLKRAIAEIDAKGEAKHDKAAAELRAIRRDLAKIREMPVSDRFDEGCQRMAFLYFANAILGER